LFWLHLGLFGMVHIESEASLNWPSDGHMFSIPMLKRKVFSQFFSLFKKKKGAILIGPSAFFWNIRHAPNRSTSFGPQLQKSRNKYTCWLYLFSLYTCELNFGQTIWDKTQVILGTSWGTHSGTWWEHIGNKGGKKKSSLPSPLG